MTFYQWSRVGSSQHKQTRAYGGRGSDVSKVFCPHVKRWNLGKLTPPTPRSGNSVMCPTRTPSFRDLTCQERWPINSWNGGDGNSITFSCFFCFLFFSPFISLFFSFLFFFFGDVGQLAFIHKYVFSQIW